MKQNSDQPQPGVTAAPVRSTQASPPATCASSHPSPPAGPLLLDQKPHSIGKLLSSILLPKQRGQHKADTADHSTAPSSCTPSIHTSGLPDVRPQSQPSRQQDNIQHCESFYSHPAQVSPQAGDSSAGHVEIQDEHLASAHPQSPVGERDTHSSESDWDALGGGDEQAAGSNVGALDAWQCGPDAWSASVSVSGGECLGAQTQRNPQYPCLCCMRPSCYVSLIPPIPWYERAIHLKHHSSICSKFEPVSQDRCVSGPSRCGVVGFSWRGFVLVSVSFQELLPL